MNKNKKIILTIITVLVSTILFMNVVDAETIMLLNCKYLDQCKNDSFCKSGKNNFVRLTNNKGNIDWYAVYDPTGFDYTEDIYWHLENDGKYSLEFKYVNMENSDYCWIDNYSHLNDHCDENKSIGWEGKDTYFTFFEAGVCPSGVREAKEFTFGEEDIVPAGKDGQTTEKTLYLEKSKYIIYQYVDKDGTKKQIAEGYNYDGKYCLIGADLEKTFYDEIKSHQLELLRNSMIDAKSKGGKFKISFFDVDTNFNNLIISGKGMSTNGKDKIPTCENETDCVNNHGYKILLDSNDSNGAIAKGVKNWLSTNNEKFESLKKITEVVKDENFMTEVNNLTSSAESGKSYKFKNGFTNEKMISKLEEAYEGLNEAYKDVSFTDCVTENKTDAYSSFISCKIYQEYLGIDQISDLITDEGKKDSEHMLNQNHIVEMIVEQTRNEMDRQVEDGKINLLDSSRDLKKYTKTFYYAVAYMHSNTNAYFLNANQIERINKLYEDFGKLSKEKNLEIYPITSCEELIGESLKNKIESYLNIVRIAIPIVLMAFGIIEFTKAVFANDEEAMKKAQKDFIKRIFIAILIFLVPTVVNLLLTLANKVWSIINPNTCGIK